MPFIEVFNFATTEEQRRETVEAIAGAIQQAFAIPAEIITTYLFDIEPTHYAHAGILAATPSARRVFIKIHALRRNVEQKRQAAALVTAGVASACGIDPSDIAIYFLDRAPDEIAHAGRLESDRQAYV